MPISNTPTLPTTTTTTKPPPSRSATSRSSTSHHPPLDPVFHRPSTYSPKYFLDSPIFVILVSLHFLRNQAGNWAVSVLVFGLNFSDFVCFSFGYRRFQSRRRFWTIAWKSTVWREMWIRRKEGTVAGGTERKKKTYLPVSLFLMQNFALLKLFRFFVVVILWFRIELIRIL